MKGSPILAEFLKDKRSKAKLSQKEVAHRLGYSTPQFVSNWERGLASPPIATLKKIGQMYNIHEEELFEVALRSAVAQVTEELKHKFNSSEQAKAS